MAVAACWGFSFVVIKAVLPFVSAQTLVVARFSLASAILLAIAWAELGRLGARTLAGGAVAGLVLWAAFSFQTLGLVETPPARAAFLTALYVPLTPLLARLCLGQRLGPLDVPAAALAFVGLALLAGPGALEGPSGLRTGDLLTLGGAFCFAVHILVLDRLSPWTPARLLALLQVAACGVLGLPLVLADERLPGLLEPRALAGVAFLGIVCTALAYGAQSWAQRFTTASRTAVILALEAVFATAISLVVTGERLRPGEWVGAGLVLGAVLLGQIRPENRAGKRPGRAAE